MLKTIRREEFKLMRSILKDYYSHVTKDNPDSLISRIYGLHKIVFYKKKAITKNKIYFCIMNNVFNTPNKIDVRYDLKGSRIGRETPAEKRKDITVALKDNDFVNDKIKIQIDGDKKKKLLKIIKQDAAFF